MTRVLVSLSLTLLTLGASAARAEELSRNDGRISAPDRGRLAKRANELIEQIQMQGIFGVALKAEDPVDLGLLQLLSAFDGEFEGAEAVRELIAQRQVISGPNSIVPAPMTMSPSALQAYTVTIHNATEGDAFDIVVLYNRIGSSGVTFLEAYDVMPYATPVFQMGACSQMQSYVVGFFVGDYLVARLPASGNMTPEFASRYNPGDVYPCADSWAIY